MPINVHLRIPPFVPSGQVLVRVEAIVNSRAVRRLLRDGIACIYPV